MFTRYASTIALAAVAAVLLHLAASAAALSPTNGYWDDPSHWKNGIMPSLDEDASITGENVHRNVNITNNVAAFANNLTLGGAANQSGSCQMSGGALEVNEKLLIAINTVSSGYFNLSGGTATIKEGRIGQYGAGLFNQSGGTLNAELWIIGMYGDSHGTNLISGGIANLQGSSGMILGHNQSANGTCYISGSSVVNIAKRGSTAGRILLGHYGNGFLQMDGGTLDGEEGELQIVLGNHTNSTGRMILNNGSIVAKSLTIGSNGPGDWEQHGGTVALEGALTVASAATSVGTALLSDGVCSCATLTICDKGVGEFVQSDSELHCAGDAKIAQSTAAEGAFINSNSVLTVGGELRIAAGQDSIGRYTMLNGSADIANVRVGRTGTEKTCDATLRIIGTNNGMVVSNRIVFNPFAEYEVTLTPDGFTAPECDELYLSAYAILKINALEKLPHTFDNQEFTIMRRNQIGNNNVADFRNVTVETGEEYGDIQSATVLYYEDCITIQLRVNRPPYGTHIRVR